MAFTLNLVSHLFTSACHRPFKTTLIMSNPQSVQAESNEFLGLISAAARAIEVRPQKLEMLSSGQAVVDYFVEKLAREVGCSPDNAFPGLTQQ